MNMRTPGILAALLLGACASVPDETAEQRMAFIARSEALYGAQCAASTVKGTSPYYECVMALGRGRSQAPVVFVMPGPLPPAQPVYAPRSVDCTTVNYGGIVKTTCQ
jgi:hypothetical protein